jgi:hypothetical protein
VYVFEMHNTEKRSHIEEAAWLGPIREGARGSKEKNRFDRNRKLEGASPAFLA